MPAYLQQYDVLEGLKPGGIFLLNTPWSKEQLERRLPAKMKRFIANNRIQFYTINAFKIAQEAGLTGKFSISMQAAFFKLTGVLPFDIAQQAMEDEIVKAFSKKSELLVSQNLKAIALSIDALEKITIPPEWGTCEDLPKKQGNYRNPSVRWYGYGEKIANLGSSRVESRLLCSMWFVFLCLSSCSNSSFFSRRR